MKFTDLYSPMSDLTREQRNLSDYVTCCSALGLSVVIAVVGQMAPAQAAPGGRMSGYDLPSRPAEQAVPQPAPPAQAPTYRPPAPAPTPQPRYGVFSPYGPLPEGRVRVSYDGTFRPGIINGYQVYTQDNGEQGNDQMLIDGPAGREEVWLNCWVSQDWKSFGPNSEQFVHGIVASWCDWN